MAQRSFLKKYLPLPSKKRYVLYSIGYGLSTLIVPFAIQFLVNNLALAGIWLNTVAFLVIIGGGLFLTQVLRYCQLMLSEYLQREIFVTETERWQREGLSHSSPYFFETVITLKAFSTAFSFVVEIILVAGFGLLAIASFHPLFLVLTFLLVGGIYSVFINFDHAVITSIEESNKKYAIYYAIKENSMVKNAQIDGYLSARDVHFSYVKRNTIIVSAIIVLGQLLLLGGGIYLVQKSQVSVGQLVSAEIILSGILISIEKLPKALESIYDFETSQYKLNLALEEHGG